MPRVSSGQRCACADEEARRGRTDLNVSRLQERLQEGLRPRVGGARTAQEFWGEERVFMCGRTSVSGERL